MVALVVGSRAGVIRQLFPTHSQVYAEMSSTNGAGASRSVSIEQAEALLRSLTGVAAARVMSGPQGKVVGVQIQASDELPPHQIARNVQSALLARFGLLLDSGLIEFVSQIPSAAPEASGGPEVSGDSEPPGKGPGAFPTEHPSGGAPVQAAALGAAAPLPHPPGAVRPQPQAPAPKPGPDLIERPTIERLRPNRIRCRVEIEFGDKVVAGEAEMLDRSDAALSVTARAVLDACRNADPGSADSMALEGIQSVELAGRSYILAGVRAVEPRNVHYLAGAAPSEAAPEEAAALATLQAVQQWIARRSSSARGLSR